MVPRRHSTRSQVGIILVLGLVLITSWWLFHRTGVDETAHSAVGLVQGHSPAPETALPSLQEPPSAVQQWDPELIDAVRNARTAFWSGDVGASTPDAAAASVLSALAMHDASLLKEVCVSPLDVLSDDVAKRLASQGARTGFSAMFRHQQVENYTHILQSADWSTAELELVTVVPHEADSLADIQIRLTLEGTPATLVITDVAHVAGGWWTVSPYPLKLQLARFPGQVIR
jgi:hypothetical protein